MNRTPDPNQPDAEHPVLSPALEAVYARHDLLNAAWEFLYQIRRSPEYVKSSSAAASMMRVILAKGEEPEDRAVAFSEAIVVGSILHGIAPRDEAQWAIATKFYDEKTLEDLRHWTPVHGYFGHPALKPGQSLCECGCFWRREDGSPWSPARTEDAR